MPVINIIVRSRKWIVLYTKVSIDFNETVGALIKKICEKHETLEECLLDIVFRGSVLDNSRPINSYGLYDGVTVHGVTVHYVMYKASYPAEQLSDDDMSRLPGAFRMVVNTTLEESAKYEMIDEISWTTPGLADDLLAWEIFRRNELAKFDTDRGIKYIAYNHPALAAGVLNMYEAILKIKPKSHPQSDNNAKSVLNTGSDDGVKDVGDSSEGSSNPVSSNASFGGRQAAITAEELAICLGPPQLKKPRPSTSGVCTANGITENDLGSNPVSSNASSDADRAWQLAIALGPPQLKKLQPSTSGARTANGITENDLGSNPVSSNASFGADQAAITAEELAIFLGPPQLKKLQPRTSGARTANGITENDLGSVPGPLQNQQTPKEIVLSIQLQIMREMGLTNEAENLDALSMCFDLESALDVIFSSTY